MQNLSLRWCHTRDVKQTKCIPMVHIWQELSVQIPNEAIGGLKGSPLPVFCLLFPLYCWKSTGKRFVKIFIYFRKTFIFSCNNKPFSATKWIRIRILKEYFINPNRCYTLVTRDTSNRDHAGSGSHFLIAIGSLLQQACMSQSRSRNLIKIKHHRDRAQSRSSSIVIKSFHVTGVFFNVLLSVFLRRTKLTSQFTVCVNSLLWLR